MLCRVVMGVGALFGVGNLVCYWVVVQGGFSLGRIMDGSWRVYHVAYASLRGMLV
jgi:hypothetical protein